VLRLRSKPLAKRRVPAKPQGTGDPTPRRATAAARRVPSKPAVQATPQGGCHQNQRYRRPHLAAAPGPEETQKAAWPLSRAETRCNSPFLPDTAANGMTGFCTAAFGSISPQPGLPVIARHASAGQPTAAESAAAALGGTEQAAEAWRPTPLSRTTSGSGGHCTGGGAWQPNPKSPAIPWHWHGTPWHRTGC